VPEELYEEIVANDAQYEEWEKLFSLSEIPANLENGSSDHRSVEWLKANPYLVLDTKHLSKNVKDRLLARIEDLDEKTDGLLIESENFQVLNLLQARYREQVKCIYLDPPYNTGSSAILYKNDYRHSSWLTLMYDRLAALKPMLPMDGAIFVSIDKVERTMLEHAMDKVFGVDNRVEELIWSMNTNNGQAPNYSTNHEFVEVYAKDRQVAEQDRDMFREPKPGFEEVMALVEELNPSYPPISVIESELRALYERHRIEFREEIEARGLAWNDQKSSDPWKGLFN
jgi:adenine-specific DNA-methyltransferase